MKILPFAALLGLINATHPYPGSLKRDDSYDKFCEDDRITQDEHEEIQTQFQKEMTQRMSPLHAKYGFPLDKLILNDNITKKIHELSSSLAISCNNNQALTNVKPVCNKIYSIAEKELKSEPKGLKYDSKYDKFCKDGRITRDEHEEINKQSKKDFEKCESDFLSKSPIILFEENKEQVEDVVQKTEYRNVPRKKLYSKDTIDQVNKLQQSGVIFCENNKANSNMEYLCEQMSPILNVALQNHREREQAKRTEKWQKESPEL